MKKIYQSLVVLILLLTNLQLSAQTTVSIGTQGTTVASAAYNPYAAYFTTSRIQFLILASEIQAAGVNAPSLISDLSFNIQAAISGTGSCSQGSVSNGQVLNYTIGLKNTTQGLPLTAYDYVGITNVYNVSLWEPKTGWNFHGFNLGTFAWDGTSNILVDICSANVGTTCSQYCYTSNCTSYATQTKDNSVIAGWADSQGSWCGSSFPNSCSYSPSGSATNYRPDCRLTFTPLAPPSPPTPNFQFTLGSDTLWEKVTSTLINTSTNASKSYWNVTGFNATTSKGPFAPYNTLPLDTLQCNPWGCFIDTNRNNPNFNYMFNTRGFYKVQLTTVNAYGVNSIEKIVLVDTPANKPTANFFATRRQLGANDRIQMNNLSTSAPARLKWWLENTCTTCGADTNSFLPNDSAFNPVLAAYTPGTYKVCLAASNSKGADTICRSNYLRILPGYMLMHSEPGRFDSVATDPEGYLYSDIRLNGGVNVSGQFRPTATSPKGFRIAPCADTIYLTLERMRMRTTGSAGGDSLYVRLNGFTGPIVRRWGGNNINAIKDTVKIYKFAGQQLFVTYVPAVTTPAVSLVNDSGFTLRWSSSAAMYNKPVAGFTCPDTLYSGYKVRFLNSSTGNRMAFAWDLNNDGAFGQDKLSVGVDSITVNPAITFTTTTPTTRKVCLKTANCVGSDTFCRVLPLLPIQFPPAADFTVNRTLGFLNDTFMFIDKTAFGATSWRWRFEPNNVTWLNGTDSTSQFPYISLNAAQSYDVTLVASNPLGSSLLKRNAIVSAIDYGSPNSAFPPVLDATDFGISRVVIQGADKKLDTITALKSPTYTRLFNDLKTTVYRGGKYNVDVYRSSANDAMSLKMWADFNRDADYTDEGENFYSEDQTRNVKMSTVMTVPAKAAIGTSRLLIGACNNISTLSSTTANVGVYEDYGLIIGNDLVKPIIRLNGSANMLTELNKSFTDPGATATDNIQGDVTSIIQTITTVNTAVLGQYSIKYFVTDMYGNTSDTMVRNVNVVLNSTGPEITLLSSDTVQLDVYADFIEPGYTAKNNLGNDLSLLVQRSGTLNNAVLGNYTLTYTITDAFGLSDMKKRVVQVVDRQKPVIVSYLGLDSVTHQIGSPFDDNKYVMITDNYWTDMTPIRISGEINTSKGGTYKLVYRNTDGSGNLSDAYTLYVTVTNKIPPSIVLVGSALITVPVYGRYNDLGVIAKDYKGDILAYSSDLNEKLRTDTIGEAVVTYTATDGFTTVTVTRTILVRDIESPSIELLGANPVIIGLCKDYVDPGVKVTDNYDQAVYTSVTKKDGLGIQISIDSSKVNTCGGGFYYTVFINATDANGNKAEEKKRVVYISMVGLADVLKTEGFSMYPNPATSFMNVELEQGSPETITVYDVQGKATKLNPVKDGKGYRLDLTALSSGMYMIRIETVEGSTFSGKFTVLAK